MIVPTNNSNIKRAHAYLLLLDECLGVLHVLLQLHIVALEGIILLCRERERGKECNGEID